MSSDNRRSSREIRKSPTSNRNIRIHGKEYDVETMSPKVTKIKNVETPRYNLEFTVEEEEKVEIKKKEPKKKIIDYDNLTKDEEFKMRSEYTIRRKMIKKRHPQFKKVPKYTTEKYTIRQMVTCHENLVSSLRKLSSINRYKAIFLGLCGFLEAICRHHKYDFIEGFAEEQEQMMGTYDDFLYEVSDNDMLPDISKANPIYGLIITLVMNTAFILVTLFLSKLLPKDMSRNIAGSILELIRPSHVKGEFKEIGQEEDIDTEQKGIVQKFNKVNKILEVGLATKDFLTTGGGSSKVEEKKIYRPSK